MTKQNLKQPKFEPTSKMPSMWSNLKPAVISLHKAMTAACTPITFWKAVPLLPNSEKKQKARGYDSSYACHAATIGSYKWPNGPFTPIGAGIDILLKEHFQPVESKLLAPGDVIAWLDEDGFISHTARLGCVYRNQALELEGYTRLASKNGGCVYRERILLDTLKKEYGSEILFYREKSEPVKESVFHVGSSLK